MEENREAKMEELASIIGVCFGSVFRLIHAMDANKDASVWVPHNLTGDQRVLRANIVWRHYDRWTESLP